METLEPVLGPFDWVRLVVAIHPVSCCWHFEVGYKLLCFFFGIVGMGEGTVCAMQVWTWAVHWSIVNVNTKRGSPNVGAPFINVGGIHPERERGRESLILLPILLPLLLPLLLPQFLPLLLLLLHCYFYRYFYCYFYHYFYC